MTGLYIKNDIRSGEENLANALLIAAAPDLLEACKALLKMFVPDDAEEMFAAEADASGGIAGPNLIAIRIARAAIAKAEQEATK